MFLTRLISTTSTPGISSGKLIALGELNTVWFTRRVQDAGIDNVPVQFTVREEDLFPHIGVEEVLVIVVKMIFSELGKIWKNG